MLGSSSRITPTREFLMRVIWLREDVGTILVVGSSIEMNEIPHDATMKRISVEMLWKFTAMDEVAGVPQTHVSWTLSTKEPGLGIFHADAALVLAQLGHLAERRVAVDRSADIDDNVTIRNRADLEQHSPDEYVPRERSEPKKCEQQPTPTALARKEPAGERANYGAGASSSCLNLLREQRANRLFLLLSLRPPQQMRAAADASSSCAKGASAPISPGGVGANHGPVVSLF
jgi:hypothetical protein